ncbi:MAG: tetratricopeptide repeat protein [Flavobacteriales bacterium]|nr:tetratricopeptide repeat protein [Flavobacteriales bacterium]
MMDQSWHKYQYYQLRIIEQALSANPPTPALLSLQISLAGALNNIGYLHMSHGENPLALEYYHKSLKINEEISRLHPELIEGKQGMANSYNNIGGIYMNQGTIPLALEYYHKSLKIHEEISKLHPELVQGKQGMAGSYNNIGFIYKNQGAIPLALEHYHKSLKIHEEISRLHPELVQGKQGMATSYQNIGVIHENQGAIPLALEYYHKSLKIHEESSDKQGMAISYNNIGLIHMNMGDPSVTSSKGESLRAGIPLALEYLHESLKIREEISDKQGMANSYNNIGFIYMNLGDPSVTASKEESLTAGIPLALEYYHKSLKIKEEISDKQGMAYSLANIGWLHLETGDPVAASKVGQRGLKIARELGFPDLIKRNAGLLSKVAKQEGHFKEALEMYELQVQYRDSMNNEETQKASIRQQTKYEFERAAMVKEQEEKEIARIQEEELSRRDNLQYSIVLICLLVIGGLVAMLGKLSLPVKAAEGLIFFAFLILFEFLLVLSDPYVDNITGGAPAYKLLTNAVLAALIFPLHSLFEGTLKKRLIDYKRKTTHAKVSVEKE